MTDCTCTNFPASLGNVTFGANVGLGTTSPSYKLDVNGTIRAYRADGAIQGLRIEGIGGSSLIGFGDGTTLGATSTWSLGRKNSNNSFRLAYNTDTLDTNIALNLLTDGTTGLGGTSADTAPWIILKGGNVGLGTTSPGSLLDVRGQVAASAGSAGAPAYTFVGNLNTGWYAPQANQAAMAVNGVLNSKFYAGALEVYTTAGNDNILRVYDSNSGSIAYFGGNAAGLPNIYFGRQAAGSPGFTFFGDATTGMFRRAAGTLSFTTGGTERVTVDAGGNVGIGTTSPAAKLHLQVPDGSPAARFTFFNDPTIFAQFSESNGPQLDYSRGAGATLKVRSSTDGVTFTERLRIEASGDLSIVTGGRYAGGRQVINSIGQALYG